MISHSFNALVSYSVCQSINNIKWIKYLFLLNGNSHFSIISKINLTLVFNSIFCYCIQNGYKYVILFKKDDLIRNRIIHILKYCLYVFQIGATWPEKTEKSGYGVYFGWKGRTPTISRMHWAQCLLGELAGCCNCFNTAAFALYSMIRRRPTSFGWQHGGQPILI